jgi:GNAT superfamily N-acetyltransferase
VKPESRGIGIGAALFQKLHEIATEQGCSRYEFSVLDWNLSSFEFYQKLGARPLREWIRFRIDLPRNG